MQYRLPGLFTLISLIFLCMQVRADEPIPIATVESTYLGLSTGALQDARLVTLPKGMVLRAGAVRITEQQVAAEIGKAKPDVQASLKKNRFFMLEQMATKSLVIQEARAWADATKWKGKRDDERALLNAYFNGITGNVTVTDEELREYYEANKELMGGATFDTVVKELRMYVHKEKSQQAINRHVQTISTRVAVEVDFAWVAAQAKTALDNPVDQARRAGKPALIDFGAEGCQACDMMTPILQDLQETYSEQCTVLYTNVRHEPLLAARYGIESIPVQVFFDKDGREVFRHVDFFPKAKILEQLKTLGVQ